MDVAWVPPQPDFVKIDIHTIEVDHPLPNGNVNGVGVIIRDIHGKMIWADMGPKKDISILLAELWGLHTAMVQALKRGLHKTHIETGNEDIFVMIRDQDEEIFDEEVEEALRQINTINENNFIEGTTVRRVSMTFQGLNRVAVYLAEYGMYNSSSFVEVLEGFGNLQYLLGANMGFGTMDPLLNVQPNFGMGEVVDGVPPSSPQSSLSGYFLDLTRAKEHQEEAIAIASPVKFPPINISINLSVICKVAQPEAGQKVKDVLMASKSRAVPEAPQNLSMLSKGNEKLYENAAFNRDGALSQKVIKLMENDYPQSISKYFRKTVWDMEHQLQVGLRVKDVLNGVLEGTLEDLLGSCSNAGGKRKGIVLAEPVERKLKMDVHVAVLGNLEEVLLDMAKFEERFF